MYQPKLVSAFNEQINYQGKLTNNVGAAVPDGTYNIAYNLYTAASGGSPIWSSTTTVSVANGLFSYMLGSDDSLSAVNFDQTLYLGVNVGGTGAPSWDGEMTPRKVLGAVPAAFEANNAQTLDNIASSSFLRSDEADTMSASTAGTLLTVTQSGGGDILNLFDGGTEVFTVTDGGSVGVGTTTPSAKFAVEGNLLTSGTIAVGSGTSTFNGNVQMTGDFVPSADNTYSLGTPNYMWKDVYIGPGSLYVNGKKVLQDISDTITMSTDINQNLVIETTGTGNVSVRGVDSGNVNVNTDSGNININSTSGNLNIGTTGAGLLNLGTIDTGVWQGSVIDEAYLDADLLTSADIGSTVQGYNANTTILGSTINASELAAEDFGAFTMSAGTASLDDNVVTPNDIQTTGQTDEYCLTYEATGTTWEWQSCAGGASTLDGLSDVDTTNVLSGNLLSYNGSSWATTSTSTLNINTDDLVEGSNQFFTNALARAAISETITGITYTSGTGVFSLDGSYVIPLTASTTEWDTAYSWGDHSTAGYESDLVNEAGLYAALSDVTQFWEAGDTLSSGAISSGFGNIDIGSSNLDADGTITFGGITNGLVVANSSGVLSASTTIGTNYIEDVFVRNTGDTMTGALTISPTTDNENHFVVQDSSANNRFAVGTDGSAHGFITLFDGSNNQDVLIGANGTSYFNAGNVGIGTTTPVEKLDVYGGTSNAKISLTTNYVGTTPGLVINNTSGNLSSGGRISFQQQGTERAYMAYQYGSGVAPSLQFGTNGDERMRINKAGNVGIGTTSPSEKLHVYASGANDAKTIIEQNGSGTNDASVQFTAGVYDYSLGIDNTDSDKFKISRSSSLGTNDRFVIDDTGNVGIGNSAPSYKLDLYDTGNTMIRAYSNGGIPRLSLQSATKHFSTSVQGDKLYFFDETVGSTRMLIDSSGNVGIGTTSPVAKLAVDGLAYIGGTGTSTVTDNFWIKGDLKVGTGSTYITGSGIRTTGDLVLNSDTGNVTLETVTSGTWQGSAIADAYVSDTLTIGASGSVNDSALSANVSLLGSAIEGTEITNATIDEVDLDTSVNASLDLADSALQSGDNISTLTNDSGYVTTSNDTVSEAELDDAFAGGGTGYVWFDDSTDTVSTETNLTDAYISDTLTIGASGSVSDSALSANVSLLGSSIDISAETNLSATGGITLTGDQLSLTNNFGSSIDSSEITNATIIEADLSTDVVAADGDFLQYDSTGDNFTWRAASEVKTDLSLNNVENTALSTWGGSSNITTVGTIGSGTWQGSAIADAYVSDTLTIGASGSVSDSALSANVTKLGSAIDLGGAEVSGTLDISDHTNLVGGTNITLSGDTLNVDDAFVSNTGDTMTGALNIHHLGDATLNLRNTENGSTASVAEAGWNYIQFQDAQGDRQGYFGISSTGDFQFMPEVSGAIVKVGSSEIWHAGNDGSSSGLDADLLDGISSAAFALDTDVDDLSGVTNASGARSNLGLGSLATLSTITSSNITNGTIDEVDLDTSVNASLDLADSALQSGDNISTLTNDSGYITDDTSVPKNHLTNSGTLSYDWADSEVADTLTIGSGSTITLAQGTAPTPTVEGRIEWDTDNDRLVIGNGTGQTTFYSGSHYSDSDVSTYLTGGTGVTETSGTISFDCSEVEGTGINCSGESITLDATGNWTGTLDGVEGADFTREDQTMLGKTGNVSLDSVTDTEAEWSNLPVGYSRMISSGISTASGTPVNNYGYFTKTANRDTAGGWGGLWVGYSAGENYMGRAGTSGSFASWDLLWSDANDGSGSSLDADLLDGISSAAFALDTDVDDLSGVTNASGARSNLGLGSLATLSTITSSEITNSTIIEADLSTDVVAADGDFLQYDSTGDNFTWRAASEVKTDLSLNNVENTALSTWGGSSNITTVGTIGSGTWQGSAIADAYVSDTLTIGASGSVSDSALSANVTKLGSAIDLGGAEVSGTLDISDHTNLVGGTNITLSGDTLNVDDAFVSNTGDTISGTLTSTAGGTALATAGQTLPNIVLDSISTGDSWTDQGAYISIGESGSLGSAATHLTYVGDGKGYVGAGSVTNGVPAGGYWQFTYNSAQIDTNANVDIGGGVDVTGNITVTGTVDGRDVASDGTKLDGIESGATADQSASEILTAIKTVDGSTSGLDADLLDGISSASFALDTDVDDLSGVTNASGARTNLGLGSAATRVAEDTLTNGSNLPDGAAVTAYVTGLGYITDGNTNWNNSYGFITDDTSVPKNHLTNSGTLSYDWADSEVSDTLTIGASGSVSDSALSSNVALLNAGQTFSGLNDFSGDSIGANRGISGMYSNVSGNTSFGATVWSLDTNWDGDSSGNAYNPTSVYGVSWLRSSNSNADADIGEGLYLYTNGSLHAGIGTNGIQTDGSIVVSGTVDGRDVASDGTKLDGIESGATADQSAAEILAALITVDGAGSNLDADKLDNISSASFLRSDTADSASGALSFSGGLSMTGSASNIALGSNWLSGDGADEGIFIDAAGDVGIGDSTPDANLTIIPSAEGNGMEIMEADDGAIALSFHGYNSTGVITGYQSGSTKFYMDPSWKMYYTGGNTGFGTTTPYSTLGIESTSLNGNVTGGISQYIGLANSTASAVQYGDRAYIKSNSSVNTTIVGDIIRFEDTSTNSNTVRGMEVQTHRGTNTNGENTALSGFALTFGVRGTTEADAGGFYEPAGGFFESKGTTQGNAIRGYSGTITSSDLLSLYQEDSAFSGTGLLMNFGNSTGSFEASTSKFVDFQNAGTSKFTVAAHGTTTIGDGTTNYLAGLRIGYGAICIDNDGSCEETTPGRITSVSQSTGNSDLAEMYFSSQSLEPGEIVVSDNFISVKRATMQNGQILGVVSTKPGLLLGSDDTPLKAGTGYPLALSGRVPVKLSDENGEIKAGDPLTLSSLPGVAMKATEGSEIVGYALEDYDGKYAYTEGFINQFGDDIAEPNYEAINVNTRANEAEPCYFGGGGVSDEAREDCDAKDNSNEDEEAEKERIAQERYEAEQEALEALRYEIAKSYKVGGKTVAVGTVTMFVDRGIYLAKSQTEILNELTSTSTDLVLGAEEGSNETLWDRLKVLAQNFVDGVLSVTGIKVEFVDSTKVKTDELCIEDVCLTADELRDYKNSLNNTASVSNTSAEEDASEDTTNDDSTTSDSDTTEENTDTSEDETNPETGSSTTTATTTEEVVEEVSTSTEEVSEEESVESEQSTTTEKEVSDIDNGTTDSEVAEEVSTNEKPDTVEEVVTETSAEKVEDAAPTENTSEETSNYSEPENTSSPEPDSVSESTASDSGSDVLD